MAKLDDYRRGIENAIIREDLAPSEEVARLWRHVRENYEFLIGLHERVQSSLGPFALKD